VAAPALRVLEGHVRAYRHVWRGSAVTTFANPLLYLVAMGLGLGTLIDRGAGDATLGGFTYLEFLAPGLLAATTMQTGASDGAWPVMMGMKWQKTYHSALATPMRAADLLFGHLAWSLCRAFITAAAFIAVMVLVGATTPGRGLVSLFPAMLTGLAFAAPISAFTATLDNDYSLSGLFRFGIMPMFLFSGTFFPISQLPGWLHPVAYATPLWHGVELTRASALGLSPAWPAAVHAGYLALWVAAGALAALVTFRRRLVT
jgi:lipooligosaccharide transport system permease protein